MSTHSLKDYKSSSYLNAIIEILFNCYDFRRLVVSKKPGRNQPMYALQKIFMQMTNGQQNIDLKILATILGFERAIHLDATWCLESIIEHCLFYAKNENEWAQFYIELKTACFCNNHKSSNEKQIQFTSRAYISKLNFDDIKDDDTVNETKICDSAVPKKIAWK